MSARNLGEEDERKNIPVATSYILHISRPFSTSSSVMVGWERLWSIILARSAIETLMNCALSNVIFAILFLMEAALVVLLFDIFGGSQALGRPEKDVVAQAS